jgi:hypothetical protein
MALGARSKSLDLLSADSLRRADNPKPQVVVTIGRRIVVAIRRAQISGGIVPTTAAIHAIRAFRFSNQTYLYAFEFIRQALR